MPDEDKSKKQLIDELHALRKRVAESEKDKEERKRAEQALQESQQMLQSVLDTIPVRVFWKNLDSSYLGCNRSFALDAGLQSPDEIIGRKDYEMGWAEQAELYRSDDRFVMETGGQKLGYEEPQTTPDGGRIWLRTNKVPLLDTEGRIKGVLGTYEDITESKRMVEILRDSEAKYRVVADNTYDWEYWVNPDGRFLYTSPSCQRITGYATNEFEADPKQLSRIVHPDDFAQFEAHSHLEQDQTTNVSCELEFRIIHRDGSTRWIGHVCQTLFDAQGCFLGRRGSNRDITDRKKAEQALLESSHKLKLFAYSVAHDLKSPAIGVFGLAKRLSKNYKAALDERGMNYCDQIQRASEHIAALVDKVNVYIATKEDQLTIESINITDILKMLKEEFSARLNIRCIEWLEPETAIEIRADRLSMIRAFRNFLDNSLKYGGERLSKIWTAYKETDDFHIFSFSDNGNGLQEDDSEKIFGAFKRNETSKGIEGTGLGLTIVKEIAERHGGKVWVEPRKKKGTTFYISISKNLST
jgi:PAS domain S-box-containing protein